MSIPARVSIEEATANLQARLKGMQQERDHVLAKLKECEGKENDLTKS